MASVLQILRYVNHVTVFNFSSTEDQAHQEFKKHVGAACVMFDPEQSLLLVLVRY